MIKPSSVSARRSRSAQTVRQRFRELEQQVRTIICLSGISRVVSLLLGGMILYGCVDWMLHLNDSATRLLAGLSLAAGVGWIAWRWLWSPLTEQRPNSSLAALLEHRRPYIGNQLSSAAEFLEHGLDPRLGSPILQQAVIDQAEHRLESLDFDAVVDRRDVRRQALLSAVICGTALLLVVLFPTEAATAVTRLMFPFSQIPWPRRVQLQLVEHDLTPWSTRPQVPRRVVRGDSLELYVRNLKGELPDDIQLEYRIEDDRIIREPLRKTILRDEQGHPLDVAGINLPVTRGPMQLRAIGGDDDLMEFVSVELVLPPELSELRLRLEPPSYTGQAAQTLPDGVGDIQAMVGTRVRLSARASQPLSKAELVFQTGTRHPLDLSSEGTSLTAEFVLDDPKATGYRLELTNRDGFGSGERSNLYSLRLIPDQIPQVTLEDPSADVTATADAVLPLRVSLKDDLGLTSARLVHVKERTQDSQPQELSFYPDHPTEDRLTKEWSLEDLQLSAGDRLQFQIEATDTFDLGPPHIGRSSMRTVTIVGAEEKRDELTNRLGELLADLSESIAVQRRVADQTQQLQTELQQESQVRPQVADLLRKLDLEQQRVLHQLVEPGTSVRAQADRLLDEFEANHLSNNETTERLESLAESLTEMSREALPELQRGLTQAQKAAGNSAQTPAEPFVAELDKLTDRQTETLHQLEELEQGLADWRDRRHVVQQLSGLIEAQRSLNRSTRAAAEQQLTREANPAPSQEQGELQKLAQRQRAEADAIDQFRKQLAEITETLSEKDAEVSDRLEALAKELERSDIVSQLREAAASLKESHPLAASEKQADSLRQLEELENLLEHRPPDDQELLVKQMKSLEDELDTLQKAEEQLAKDFQAAANESDPQTQTETLEKLTQRQDELREELAEIERQLERLELQRPREAVHRAGERMEQLAESPGDAQEQQDSFQETLDDLEQSRRELAQERQRAEEELAFEQLLKLKDELAGLALRQTAVFEEVKRLEQQRSQRGTFKRGQIKSLKQTAETERELSQQIDALAQRLEAVEVLMLTLKKVSRRMQGVADNLDLESTDESVQQQLQAVEEQLQRLLALLDPAATPGESSPQPGEESPSPPENQAAGPPGDVITLITQLELLKDLQADCVRRTQQLQTLRDAGGELTPTQTQELDALQQDQSQLTDLARNLLTKLLQEQPPPPAGRF